MWVNFNIAKTRTHFNDPFYDSFAAHQPACQPGTLALEGLREYSLRLLASVPSFNGQARHPLSFSHFSPLEQESFAEKGRLRGIKVRVN